jgi:predicted lipoprotein
MWLGSLSAATGKPVSREAALDNIARSVLLPGYLDLAARSRAFAAAADDLATAPSPGSLKKTQHAWRDTLVAWRQTRAFTHGPLADLGVSGRIQFWPARPQSVERVLAASRPLTDTYVDELGANAVGLSALEVLLFGDRVDDAGRLASFSGTAGARRREYLRALAADLVKKTQLVASRWQGPAGYAATFAMGGQQQLNVLFNDLRAALDLGVKSPLQTVLDRQLEPQFPFEQVEGSLSGVSQQSVLAVLAGVRRAYSGGEAAGIDDYLAQLSPQNAMRLDDRFQKTIAAVQALGGPIEQAIGPRESALRQANDACHSLEMLLKVEVASTLGVTLTFKATDGD